MGSDLKIVILQLYINSFVKGINAYLQRLQMFLSNLKSLDIVAQFFVQVASKSSRLVFFILLDTTSIVLSVSKKLDFAAREHVKRHLKVTWFKLNESAC